MGTAKNLCQEAEKKLQSGFFGFLTGGPNYDAASDLYQQAANQYKLSKEWEEASNCFVECAKCAQKSGSSTDEANFLMEAGNVMKRVSSVKAVEQYEKAISIYNAAGRFQNSGKLLMSIAELYENERLQHKEVKEYYKRAAEMFELDDHGKSNFSKCNLKYAEYCAKDGDLQAAIEIFESEGEKALQNNLLQYGAKDHFFRAGILHLATGDTVNVNLAVDKYRSLDPRFSGSREGALLGSLAEAFEEKNIDVFVEKLQDFDAITPLDAWKTEFLVKVKELMQTSATDDLDLT